MLAFAIRLALSFKGSIWADEGLVLNIVRIPSWHEMINFLARHESHPPFFYLLMRAWGGIFGDGVSGGLALTSLVGALVVPATAWAAGMMASARAAIVATVLVAFSPSLAEHASQLRPYGLLPVLSVISVATLYTSLSGRAHRSWAAYAVATTLLVYSHHWGWLVVGGHVIAGAWLVTRLDPGSRWEVARQWAVAIAVIAVAYGFWMRPLLYQIGHTGHLPSLLEGAELVGYYFFAMLNLPNMFWGTYPPTLLPSVLIGAVAGLAMAALGRQNRLLSTVLDDNELRAKEHPFAGRFLLLAGVIPLTLALAVSPRSNMLLDRCVVAVVPMLLIAASVGVMRLHRIASEAAFAVIAFAVVAGSANIVALAGSQRSNARDVAAILLREKQPGDFVIVVPEWIAPSFNHYFAASLPQMDFPNAGRSGLLDFAEYRDKVVDTAAFERVASLARLTAETDRRVWLVTARRFLTQTDSLLPGLPPWILPRAVSAVELGGVRERLADWHGPPDTTRKADRRSVERYEELVLLLFDKQQGRGTGR